MKSRISRFTTDLGPEGESWARLYVDFVVDGSAKRSRAKDLEVVAMRFVAVDSARKHGDATFRLGDFFRRLDAVKSDLEREIVKEAEDEKLDLSWLHGESSLDERLRVLRDDYLRRARSGGLVGDVTVREETQLLSLSQAAEYAGVSIDELIDLEKQGLLVAKRTNGGRRRYSTHQLEEVKNLQKKAKASKRGRGNQELVDQHQQQTGVYLADEPMAAMASTTAQEARLLTPRERRHLTVITVAQLYLMAFFRFPEREGSVIEYIRSEMEWLSARQVTTYVRQARHRSGIPLPIFRQGRIRKRRLFSEEPLPEGAGETTRKHSARRDSGSTGREQSRSTASTSVDPVSVDLGKVMAQLNAIQSRRKQSQR